MFVIRGNETAGGGVRYGFYVSLRKLQSQRKCINVGSDLMRLRVQQQRGIQTGSRPDLFKKPVRSSGERDPVDYSDNSLMFSSFIYMELALLPLQPFGERLTPL